MTIARTALCVAALAGGLTISACGSLHALPQAVAPSDSGISADRSADLLYLSDLKTNDVYVFSYPRLKLVGTLSAFGAPRGECADRNGNVWIADAQGYDVVEYAHGGTKAVAALSTPWAPRGCSVDPHSDTLAVTGGNGGSVLAIFHRSAHDVWRDARQYTDTSIKAAYFCGYDGHGNLFVDGLSKAKGGTFRLVELQRRAKSLTDVTFNQTIVTPGQVQWDGEHLAIGDAAASPAVVYQFSVSGSVATRVGSTVLDGTKSVRQFWIDGNRVVGPDYDSSAGLWKYPAGGSPTNQVTTVHGYGAAVSSAASSSRK